MDLNAISPDLYNPFPPDLIRWEIVTQTDGGKQVLTTPYVAVEYFEDRLNQYAPGWTREYETIAPEMVVRCELTVCGVTRIGLGSGDRAQEAKTRQAFIQACQSFGVGRYLRYLPTTWVSSDKVHAHLDGTFVVDTNIPSWAKPGGAGRPSNTKENPASETACTPEKQEPVIAKRVSLLSFANQPPKTRPLDTDFANAYELKVYGDLYLKAQLAGVDLSYINVIIPPITVGELRRRYSTLNKLYQSHLEKKGG